jgi:hypothetical protein
VLEVAAHQLCHPVIFFVLVISHNRFVHALIYFVFTEIPIPELHSVPAWGGAEFVRVVQRHMMRKQKFPDEGPARGIPYEGISNLRPESQAAVKAFLTKMQAPAM